jgi:hypothetical protein
MELRSGPSHQEMSRIGVYSIPGSDHSTSVACNNGQDYIR